MMNYLVSLYTSHRMHPLFLLGGLSGSGMESIFERTNSPLTIMTKAGELDSILTTLHNYRE